MKDRYNGTNPKTGKKQVAIATGPNAIKFADGTKTTKTKANATKVG